MKALIIYNRFSGVNGNKDVNYIKNRISKKYNIVDIYESKNDIKEYVLCNASYYDLLIVIGGDGTINQAVNGLMLVSRKPLLAYIPMGTCNDFGRSLGLKETLHYVTDKIIEGNTKLIHVNKINTDYYLYGLAIGNMTNVSYQINPILKKMFGRLSYYLNGIKHMFKNDSFELDMIIDGKHIKENCFCLMVLNTRFLASLKLRLKEDYVDSEELKIVVIKKKNKVINLFDLVMFFLMGEKYNHNVKYFNGTNIKINTDKLMRYNIDGECLPLLKNVELNRVINSINLIVYK